MCLKALKKQPPEVFYKKGVHKFSQNSHENNCARVSLPRVLQTHSDKDCFIKFPRKLLLIAAL